MAPREARLAGLRPHPAGAKTTKIVLLRPQNGPSGRYSRLLCQPLTRKIRYLPDQWKINGIFSPINELKRAYQSKNNRIHVRRENGKCGHLSELDAPPRTPTAMAEIGPGREPVRGTESKRPG
jgi:hypothetical protein